MTGPLLLTSWVEHSLPILPSKTGSNPNLPVDSYESLQTCSYLPMLKISQSTEDQVYPCCATSPHCLVQGSYLESLGEATGIYSWVHHCQNNSNSSALLAIQRWQTLHKKHTAEVASRCLRVSIQGCLRVNILQDLWHEEHPNLLDTATWTRSACWVKEVPYLRSLCQQASSSHWLSAARHTLRLAVYLAWDLVDKHAAKWPSTQKMHPS